MIIAIDPDTKQHACAMGEIIAGRPVCKRTWTIQRMDRRGAKWDRDGLPAERTNEAIA